MADDKVSEVISRLEIAQGIEEDIRENVKEAANFLWTRGGQWEDKIIQAWDKRPRYTFDMVSPVVDSIMADFEETDFALKVSPGAGDASKETALQYGGLIRNIENISAAKFIYNTAARMMCSTGISGWRIKQAYRSEDSFQQDLIIDSIVNYSERVWFDPGAIKQDMSDSKECWVLTELALADYLEQFPEGSKLSVSQANRSETYFYKKEGVVIGERLYKKEYMRELALLSNGGIVEIDDDFNKVRDELFAKNIKVLQTRKRKSHKVYQRLFDGDDYISDEVETVFADIPIIPCYGNFNIMENKILYWGAIEKLMDPARVLNYAESKKVAESSLKPIEKVWMTTDQAKGAAVTRDLETSNINNKPIQLYKHVDGQLPPFKPQASQIDNVLVETASSAGALIDKSANLFNASKGVGMAGQSGETVRLLQNKGTSANYKYFKSMEIALTHTTKILIKAIPKVYDTKQELQIINEDGTFDSFVVGEEVRDEQTGAVITINDLSKGEYDVTVSSGPSFKNRQEATVNGLIQAATVDPSVLQIGSDVLLNNINTPGMGKVADRKRKQLFNSGVLTKDELSDEENKLVEESKAAMANEQQPDPNMVLAQAEMKKADADLLTAQVKVEEVKVKQGNNQINLMKVENDRIQLQIDAKTAGVDIDKTLKTTTGIQLDNKKKMLDLMQTPINI